MNTATQGNADDPRLAAYHVLVDVGRGEFADRAAARRLARLRGADRGLAQELAYGSIRLKSRLDTELSDLLDRPLERLDSRVLHWLRLGLYQIRETRVSDHAAVDQTVEGVKSTAGPKAAGLANAVLRRAIREGAGEGVFSDPNLDPEAYLTTWGSHPEWIVRRWLTRWPLASVRRLVENDNRAPPVTVRVLAEGVDSSPDLRPAPEVHLVRETGWRAMFRLEKGDPETAVRSLPSVVQDPAAAAVVDYVGDRFHGPVIDACAAPGGKTLGLAWRVPSARPFVAADVSSRRIGRLREPVSRLGLDVSLAVMDGRAPAIGRARTVLLDAPCTGTGVLRRRADARWRLSPEKLRSLVTLQRELLDGLAVLIEPGGLLVYATCSLEPEENEEQVEGFLARHDGFRREAPDPDWVKEGSVDERGDLRILPWQWNTDGAFASRLRRDTGPSEGGITG